MKALNNFKFNNWCGGKFLKVSVIFLIIFCWIFSGSFQIWKNPPIPPEIEKAKASPVVANLILLWDPNDGVVPTGWTCISCSGGQDFYQKFIRGNPTYGIVAGGSSTHTHPNASPFTSGGASGSATGGYGQTGAPVTRPPLFAHTHTASITSGLLGTNIPLYRNLKVIRYNNGIPSSLPQNIIAIFESAPSGWTTTGYNDGRYIQGENVSGTGGTANTHTHTIILGQTSDGANASGKDTATGATSGGISHYHSSGAQATTIALNHEPGYMTVVLAKKDAAGSIPANMIGMFDNTPPSANWTLKSNIPGDPFYQRFFKPTGTYGTSSDVFTHTHDNLTVTTGGPSGTTAAAVDITFSSATHGHNFTITFGTAVNHEPPYWNAIFAQASSTPTPNLEQIHFHWRNDDNNEADATSATGGTEDIVYSSFPPAGNKRLRLEISNEGGAAGQDIVFRLDYSLKGAGCGTASWTDVDATLDDDWDMYDTANFPTDGADTTNITVFAKGAVSDANPNFKTPNYAVKDTFSKVATTTLTYEDFIEMEFSIKPNVTSGTYCFRVSNDGDITNFTYTRYAEATVAIAYTVGCNASTSTTDFGTLTTSAVSTSTPDVIITASTTYPGGFTLYVRDSNAGLYSTAAAHLVTSTTATLEIGIAGYGIQASTTSAEITIDPIYLKTGDDVGALSTSSGVVLANSTEPFPDREVKVKHKATISNLTKAASDYIDTITYSCSGN